MKKTKTRFIPGFLLGMLATFVVAGGIIAGMIFSDVDINIKSISEKNSETSVSEGAAKKLKTLEAVIDAYYLNEIKPEDLEEGIYKGLLSGLKDPYSVYYTAEEYKELIESTEGVYYGIGSLVSQDMKTGTVTATRVFKNSPAMKAGMKRGDIIYKVDEKEVTGQELEKIVAKMKGKENTEVKITVYRASEKKYIDLVIKRGKVEVPTIEYKMLDKKKGIGYIQIVEFEEVTYDQFSNALKALKKQGMKSVVFDVRDNPGGIYQTVCRMLDDILPDGTLVYTKDKYGNEEKQTSDKRALNMPIAVLQNENSASAAEIFAGAIQDFNAGKIVGTQSFGKGIVQTVLPLNDGSAIKLTIEDYYTPSGKNIHGKGITPDVKVESTDNDKRDIQLEKAVEILK